MGILSVFCSCNLEFHPGGNSCYDDDDDSQDDQHLLCPAWNCSLLCLLVVHHTVTVAEPVLWEDVSLLQLHPLDVLHDDAVDQEHVQEQSPPVNQPHPFTVEMLLFSLPERLGSTNLNKRYHSVAGVG